MYIKLLGLIHFILYDQCEARNITVKHIMQIMDVKLVDISTFTIPPVFDLAFMLMRNFWYQYLPDAENASSSSR